MTPTIIDKLRAQAARERSLGNFVYAADLFRQVAMASTDAKTALHAQMRRAHCLAAAGHIDKAIVISERVAQHARSESLYNELIDALSQLVDTHHDRRELLIANQLLGEAMYVLDQIADDLEHLPVHNLGVSLSRCGHQEAAIQMYTRALNCADIGDDRALAYANIAAAYNLAAIHAEPTERRRLASEGLRAADAALGPSVEHDVLHEVVARSHRSMLLTWLDRWDDALAEAKAARGLATAYGMIEEEVVAATATCVARWNVSHDRAVLADVRAVRALDTARQHAEINDVLDRLEVEMLITIGRADSAVTILLRQNDRLTMQMREDAEATLAQVRLGAEIRQHDLLSESDVLTGLGNRRMLLSVLGEYGVGVGGTDVSLLGRQASDGPACLCVLDIDDFHSVNTAHGYQVGDRLLQEIGRVIERVCRRGDVVVRLGGDEFVVVLAAASPSDARTVLERTRVLIANHRWDAVPELRLTVSIGFTTVAAGTEPDHLLSEARAAVTAAKRLGTDRVVLHTADI